MKLHSPHFHGYIQEDVLPARIIREIKLSLGYDIPPVMISPLLSHSFSAGSSLVNNPHIHAHEHAKYNYYEQYHLRRSWFAWSMVMTGPVLVVLWVVAQEVPNLKMLMLSEWYSVYRYGGSNGTGYGTGGSEKLVIQNCKHTLDNGWINQI